MILVYISLYKPNTTFQMILFAEGIHYVKMFSFIYFIKLILNFYNFFYSFQSYLQTEFSGNFE